MKTIAELATDLEKALTLLNRCEGLARIHRAKLDETLEHLRSAREEHARVQGALLARIQVREAAESPDDYGKEAGIPGLPRFPERKQPV